METFSALLAICAGNSPVPVNSPHKGKWFGALMFSLICVWIKDWVNNREAGYLRRHRGHYDVNVMLNASIQPLVGNKIDYVYLHFVSIPDQWFKYTLVSGGVGEPSFWLTSCSHFIRCIRPPFPDNKNFKNKNIWAQLSLETALPLAERICDRCTNTWPCHWGNRTISRIPVT